MNALFLYNENVPLTLKDSFADSLGSVASFKILKDEMLTPSFSVDRKISEYLLSQEIEQKRYSVIFIPYSLSEENYMEFLGLRMAYHIRLTKDFNNIQTPIVFYGLESEWEINKLTNLGQILFTSNIYSIQKINIDDFQKTIKYIQESSSSLELSDESFTKKIVSKISLNPPGNYQSHHSIDNELALLRWSTYLGCDNEIPEVKNNLNNGLYFKYYNALNPIEKPKKGAPFLIEGKSKVLLIDDESDKGWYTFYNSFFRMSPSITFEALNIDYKRLPKEELIQKAIDKINDFNADVVLLDLRLCDTDFSKGITPENLTGAQILNQIKQEVNKGVQVIITTASNKVWSYTSTITYEDNTADGYVVKNGEGNVAETIKEIRSIIYQSIVRSKYLKNAYKTSKTIIDHLESSIINHDIDQSFREELIVNLEISLSMFNSSNSKDSFAYSYLSLFKCLELIGDKFSYYDDYTWKILGDFNLVQFEWENNKYEIIDPPQFKNSKPSTFEKTASLYFQLLKYNDREIKDLYYSIRRRNEFIHPTKKEISKNLQKECDKIYNDVGFNALLQQLEKIIIGLV